MNTSRLLLCLLATQASTALLTGVVTATVIVVTARQALRGAPPQHRAAILRSLAEIARALGGRKQRGE
ncbi:hypothetical protein [Streptomyces sp. NBC_00388]|uniref:hypothetical protein n=1 Tax=Streptomyces sp. NBC_00388 TaxID=2975735 RepID=UPI002E223766